MQQLLSNILWHSLNGAHRAYSAGTEAGRRYAKGFSPIIGFPDQQRPDLAALAPFCAPDEHFYCDGWSGAVPAGWQLEAESSMFKMVWAGALPPEPDPALVRLRAEHAEQALALATLTRPGPFGPRTPELGTYYGVFDGARLVAMAGERMFAGNLREISGVCTDPQYQGRGLARKLMYRLIHDQLARQEVPFLHVMHDNHGAHQLYARMGFSRQLESVVRVVSRA